jgi:Ca2+-binding RTX toxin-like protein
VAAPFTRTDIAHGGSGNDVMIGGLTGLADTFYGDAGNDVLVPTPWRTDPLGSVVTGGDGNDIAILVNGTIDGFIMGKYVSSIPVPLPVKGCAVDVPLTVIDKTKQWGAKCKLLGQVNIKLEGSKVSIENEFFSKSFVSWTPGQWNSFAVASLSNLSGDLCICDAEGKSLIPDKIY